MAALAVLLILLGAAGSALIALRSGEREDFVAVSRNLDPGHKLEESDLARASVAGDTGGLVPWSQAKSYLGRYTTAKLFKNQFITKDMFTKDTLAPVPSGGALVGVSLEGGRVPAEGLKAGDIVRVVRVPATSSEGGTAQVLVSAAEVTEVPVPDAKDRSVTDTSSVNATVLVPTSKSTDVAAAAAAKTLVLIKVAPGTKPEIARITGGG